MRSSELSGPRAAAVAKVATAGILLAALGLAGCRGPSAGQGAAASSLSAAASSAFKPARAGGGQESRESAKAGAASPAARPYGNNIVSRQGSTAAAVSPALNPLRQALPPWGIDLTEQPGSRTTAGSTSDPSRVPAASAPTPPSTNPSRPASTGPPPAPPVLAPALPSKGEASSGTSFGNANLGSGFLPQPSSLPPIPPPRAQATPRVGVPVAPVLGFPRRLRGEVTGGFNPISGAFVSLYAMGNSGYGTGASQLASASTDNSGLFELTGYGCPSNATQTYIVAAGGDAGAGSNPAIGLVALTGECGNLGNSSFVVVNELTTIAAEWGLAQFSDQTGQIFGSSSGNATGLLNALTLATDNLVAGVGTGPGDAGVGASFLPTPAQCSGSSAPVNCEALEKLDTLANVLAACVTSSGLDSTPCAALYDNASGGSGPPPLSWTTLAAAHGIAARPAANVDAIFALREAGSGAPYQPDLAVAPNDWTLALNYTGGGLASPAAVAIDGSGNAWVTGDTGAVVKLSPAGAVLSGPSGITGGGLDHSFSIAIDSSANLWVANKYNAVTDGTVTELSAAGSILSGANGYSGGNIDYPLSVALDQSGNVWVANYANSSVTENPQSSSAANFTGGGLSFPVSVAIDASGNVWVANFGDGTVSKLAPNGSLLSPSGGFTAGGLDGPNSITADTAGNAWVANYYGDSVTLLTGSGAAGAGSPFTAGGLSGPAAIMLDGDGNAWVANYRGNSISGLQGSQGTSPGSPLSGTSGYQSGGLTAPDGLAVDASGNLWVCNYDGASVTEFVGVAVPVKTPVIGPPSRP